MSFYQWEIINKSNNRSLVISGENTKELAEEKARKSMLYYTSECNYSVSVIIREMCQSCYNTGIVKIPNKRNKLIVKSVKCPECKGKYPQNEYTLE